MADSTIQKAKSAVAKIAKHFTDGALMVMSDTARGDVEVVPTGSLGLDRALGVGEAVINTPRNFLVRAAWR